jgi:ketosteroid isomerase-like protein
MSEMRQLQPEPGWGRTTGHTRIGRLSHSEAGRALDRLEIAERVYRYGWGFDERDPELLGDCFTDDAVWEGSIMGQVSVGPFAGREKIVEWLATFWDEQHDQRRHIFTNLVIQDLTEDTAVAHAYLLLTATSEAKTAPVTNGPYRFELLRQDDSWRLVRLVAGFDAPF